MGNQHDKRDDILSGEPLADFVLGFCQPCVNSKLPIETPGHLLLQKTKTKQSPSGFTLLKKQTQVQWSESAEPRDLRIGTKSWSSLLPFPPPSGKGWKAQKHGNRAQRPTVKAGCGSQAMTFNYCPEKLVWNAQGILQEEIAKTVTLLGRSMIYESGEHKNDETGCVFLLRVPCLPWFQGTQTTTRLF